MTTVVDLSREYKIAARMAALVAPYVAEQDRGSPQHVCLAVRLSHILVYDWLRERDLDFTEWHRRNYEALCRERDQMMRVLGIEALPDFVATGVLH